MNKELLRLAIPNILSNISVPLLSTVDTALMGRLSLVHIGAVGVASMVFNFIYWNFGFLRMGTTGITAQSFGKKDDAEIISTLIRAGLLAFMLALILFLFQQPLCDISVRLMNLQGEQAELMRVYFFIRIWAAPATLMLYVIFGWFFGMQNAIFPLILTLFINVTNIGISYYLTMKLDMDIRGVAIGTVIAQYAGLIIGLILFAIRYKKLWYDQFRRFKLSFKQMRRFLEINSDIFIRTVFLSFSFAFFYSMSGKLGEMTLAVNVILLQFVNWMSYGIDGFAFASESLVGKYKGAQDKHSLYRSIKLSFIWSFALSLFIALIYYFKGSFLLSIFTNELALIEAAEPFLFWMMVFPIVAFASYIWDGVYIGLTATKAMRNSMFIALIIYLLMFFVLREPYQNHGLWAALCLFLLARGLIQSILFFKFKEQLK